jgi:hypothetical protein
VSRELCWGAHHTADESGGGGDRRRPEVGIGTQRSVSRATTRDESSGLSRRHCRRVSWECATDRSGGWWRESGRERLGWMEVGRRSDAGHSRPAVSSNNGPGLHLDCGRALAAIRASSATAEPRLRPRSASLSGPDAAVFSANAS